jgi:hypothetical protein
MVCFWHGNAVASGTAEPQEKSIRITIKENHVYAFTSIEKVEYWGIVVSENGTTKTILYKVIEKIEMPDSSLAAEIEYHVPGIEVTEAEGIFTLDFKRAKIPVLQYKENGIIEYRKIRFALRLDAAETFEAGLGYSLWPLHALHHDLSFSTGFPYGADPSYHVMAINYGIGTSILTKRAVACILQVSYHRKILTRTYGVASEHVAMNAFSIEPQVLFFSTKRVFPSVSLRYYFNDFEIDNSKMQLSLIASVNVALGKGN